MSLQYHSCTANKTGSSVSLTQKGYQTKVRITFTNYYFGSSNLSLFDKEDTVEHAVVLRTNVNFQDLAEEMCNIVDAE